MSFFSSVDFNAGYKLAKRRNLPTFLSMDNSQAQRHQWVSKPESGHPTHESQFI